MKILKIATLGAVLSIGLIFNVHAEELKLKLGDQSFQVQATPEAVSKSEEGLLKGKPQRKYIITGSDFDKIVQFHKVKGRDIVNDRQYVGIPYHQGKLTVSPIGLYKSGKDTSLTACTAKIIGKEMVLTCAN